MTIIEVQVENVKGVKAIRIQPNGSPLVILKGNNEAGKSSVIDAIWYNIGGKDVIPEQVVRHGEKTAFSIVDLGDLVIERRWTKGGERTYLEVRDANGVKQSSPQTTLDKLYSRISFDPLSFMRMPAKKQAIVLRDLAGLDFSQLDADHSELFQERKLVNRRVKELEGQLAGMPVVNAPSEEVSAAALTEHLAEIQTRASSLTEKRTFRDTMREALVRARQAVGKAEAALDEAKAEAARIEANGKKLTAEIEEAEAAGAPTQEEVAEVRKQITEAEETNRRVREKKKRGEVAENLDKQRRSAETLTQQLEEIDDQKKKLLSEAKLPVEGLMIEEDHVSYNDVPLEQCSSAVQWKVSTGVGFKLNGDIKIVAIRDGSLLDERSLAEVAHMAAKHDGQVLIERVGKTGGPPGVIIEDGEVELVEDGAFEPPAEQEASMEVDL